MEEKQLEILFKQFLIGKGYPKDSLISHVALRTTDEGIFHPDLVILDIENKEYLAIIEFKNKVNEHIKVNTLGQFYKYFSLIGTQAIPSFLVFPTSESEFQILILTKDNTFEPITLDEFPSFETLSAKVLIEEKKREKEIELKTLKEIELKKRKSRQISYLSLISLMMGVIATFITMFWQQKSIQTKDYPKIECCDSIQNQYLILRNRLNALEKQFNTLSTPSKAVDSFYSSASMKKIDTRLKIIENGISENPEKALSIVELNNDIKQLKQLIDHLKELNQAKIDGLSEKLDLVNAFTFGLLITIFGSILSYAITNLRVHKTEENR